MQKRDFETYQKRFRDFEILLKFSETNVFRSTIRHPLNWVLLWNVLNYQQFGGNGCFGNKQPSYYLINNWSSVAWVLIRQYVEKVYFNLR